MKKWQAVGFPLPALLSQYIIWRAVWLTLFHRSIRWRGTHYSLANKV